MNLKNFKLKIHNMTGRTGLMVQKHSPEILMGVGVASFIWTIVLACKETSRAEEILNDHKSEVEFIKKSGEFPSVNEQRKEKAVVYAKTAGSFAKLYAPAAATGTMSIACFFKAYNIVNTRYLGAVAAYNAVSSAFSAYRERVRTEMGNDMDHHFMYGNRYDKIEVIEEGENGKKKKKEEAVEVIDRAGVSEYAKFFDQSCAEWDPNPQFNLRWLRANETAANDILTARGHIFLNEVYDMIGLPHTAEGAVVGWIKDGGDGFVDFGLMRQDDGVKRFIDGTESVVLLDFNVDGIIFDKI